MKDIILMYLLCFAAFQMFNFRCWIKIILNYNIFLIGKPKLENQSDINEGIKKKKTLVKVQGSAFDGLSLVLLMRI